MHAMSNIYFHFHIRRKSATFWAFIRFPKISNFIFLVFTFVVDATRRADQLYRDRGSPFVDFRALCTISWQAAPSLRQLSQLAVNFDGGNIYL